MTVPTSDVPLGRGTAPQHTLLFYTKHLPINLQLRPETAEIQPAFGLLGTPSFYC